MPTAVGIPNILIWTYYFWKKDCASGHYIKNPDYYIRQNFQKFIYRLNQPFMRVDQTAFVNVSIFDRNYIESLFGGVEYPDGTFVIDEIENLIEHQKIFMEVVSQIRNENMFTFPVLTYSLLYQNGRFVDEPFARWCSDPFLRSGFRMVVFSFVIMIIVLFFSKGIMGDKELTWEGIGGWLKKLTGKKKLTEKEG